MKYLAPGLNKLSRRTNFCGISSKSLLSIPTIQFVFIKRHAKIDIKKWRRMWRMLQEVTAVRRRVLSYRMGRKKKKYIFPLIGEQLFPLVSHSLWKLSLRTCYCTFYKWVSPKDGRNMFYSRKISVFCTQKIRYFLLPIYCHWCRFRTFCILTQKGP